MSERALEIDGDALRAIRELHGFSIEHFARSLGVVPSHISNVEAGRRGLSPSNIRSAAEILHVPVSALLFKAEVGAGAA